MNETVYEAEEQGLNVNQAMEDWWAWEEAYEVAAWGLCDEYEWVDIVSVPA